MKDLLRWGAVQAAVASLCAAVLWLLRPHRSWLDGILFIAGFTVAGLVTAYLLKRRVLPAATLRRLGSMHAAVRDGSVRGLICAVGRFACTHPSLIGFSILLAVLLLHAPGIESLPTDARRVYDAATVVGAASLLSALLLIGGNEEKAAAVFTFVERLVLVSLGLALVRIFGAEGAAWVRSKPDAALAIVAGVVVVRSMLALAPNRSHVVARSARGLAHAVMPAKQSRSKKDIFRTAVHEAGHLIMCADLPELPATLSVNVMDALGPKDECRGYVRYSSEFVPDVLTEGYLRWLMLMNMAGSEAEYAVLGERADGARGDYQVWLRAAAFYLSAGFGEVFYVDPVDDAQQAHNRLVLNALKAEHAAALAARFAVNKDVLAELAGAIAEKKALTRDELAPYLARVVNPS